MQGNLLNLFIDGHAKIKVEVDTVTGQRKEKILSL
jgi:hypothetical protein